MAALLIGCTGPGEQCESNEDKRNREMSQQMMLSASIPPKVTSIEAKLAVPVTTYTVTTQPPVMGLASYSYEWSMAGEACGTPPAPWKQTGASVRWSHSDQAPDRCAHQRTDHAVVATVEIKTITGIGVRCTIEGTEDKKVDNPPCTPLAR